jgi:hypothetical protein
LLPGGLPRPSDGLFLLAVLALGRLFVRLTTPHFAKNALALHLLFENPEGLFDIVIANKYLQMFSNRTVGASVDDRMPSVTVASPDLEIVRRLLTAIADNLIFDRLTFIERTKAGAFNRGDVDEHVFAPALRLNEAIALGRVEPFDGACSHHGLLETL